MGLTSALAAPSAVVGEENPETVERVIHTDGSPPIRGKGTAILTRKGDRIEVALEDLSFKVQWVLNNTKDTENVRVTGFRVGLLSPKQRNERTGAQYGKRIRADKLLPGDATFEPDDMKVTFPGDADATLDDYQACLMILIRVNKGIEAMVLAHTAEPAAHREFFPLRANRKLPASKPNPAVAAMRQRLDQSIARLSQPYEKLVEHYRTGLSRIEETYLESGNLEGVLAAQDEAGAIGGAKRPDLQSHRKLRQARATFLAERSRIARDTHPAMIKLLKSHHAELEKFEKELIGDGKLEDARAIAREAGIIQALIDEPAQIPNAFPLPFLEPLESGTESASTPGR